MPGPSDYVAAAARALPRAPAYSLGARGESTAAAEAPG